LKAIKFKISREVLVKLYKTLLRPTLEYAHVLLDNCPQSESDLIESIQYESAKRVVKDATRGTRSKLLDELALENMKTRRSMNKLILYFKIVNNCTPNYLADLLPQTVQQRSGTSLRNAENFSLFRPRTERFKKSFLHLLRFCGII
jgi:hypothetical protein